MSFTHIVTASNGSASASTATITHGATINAGDLMVAFIFRNAATTAIDIQGASGGATWVEEVQDDPSDFTARMSIQWAIANATEPSAFTWALNTTDRVSAHLHVLRPSGATPILDTASAEDTGVTEFDGTTIDIAHATDAVSMVFYMSDTGSGTWSGVTGSYLSLTTEPDQRSGAAYKIHTTSGQTGVITCTMSTDRDWASRILSFVEGAGGGTIVPIIMNHHLQHTLG